MESRQLTRIASWPHAPGRWLGLTTHRVEARAEVPPRFVPEWKIAVPKMYTIRRSRIAARVNSRRAPPVAEPDGGAARAAPLPPPRSQPPSVGCGSRASATRGPAFSRFPIAGDVSAARVAAEQYSALLRSTKCEEGLVYDPAVGFVKATAKIAINDAVGGAGAAAADEDDSVDLVGGGDEDVAASLRVLAGYRYESPDDSDAPTEDSDAAINPDSDSSDAAEPEEASGSPIPTDDTKDDDDDDAELRRRAVSFPVDVPDDEFFLPDVGARLTVRIGSVLDGHKRDLNACCKDACHCEGVFYKEFNCLKSTMLAVVSLQVSAQVTKDEADAAWSYLADNEPTVYINYNEKFTAVTVSSSEFVKSEAGEAGEGAWHIQFRPLVDTDRLNAMCWARICTGFNVVDSGAFEIRTKPSAWLALEGVPVGWDADEFERVMKSIDKKGALKTTVLIKSSCSSSGALGFAQYSGRVRAGEALFDFLGSEHSAENHKEGGIIASFIRSQNRTFRTINGERVAHGIRHPDDCVRGIVYAQVQIRKTKRAVQKRAAARSLVFGLPKPVAVKREAEEVDNDRAKRSRREWELADESMTRPRALVLPVPVTGSKAAMRQVHLLTSGRVAPWELPGGNVRQPGLAGPPAVGVVLEQPVGAPKLAKFMEAPVAGPPAHEDPGETTLTDSDSGASSDESASPIGGFAYSEMPDVVPLDRSVSGHSFSKVVPDAFDVAVKFENGDSEKIIQAAVFSGAPSDADIDGDIYAAMADW